MLSQSKTTVRENSGSSQNCPGGRGQIRSGVTRWSEEVGGAEGRRRAACNATPWVVAALGRGAPSLGEETHERDLHQHEWNSSTVQQPTPLPKLDRFETSRGLAPERPERQDCLSRRSTREPASCCQPLPGSISTASWSGRRAPRQRALQLGPSTPSKDHGVTTTTRNVAPPMLRQSAQQQQGVVRGTSAMNKPNLPRMQAHWFSMRSAIPALPC